MPVASDARLFGRDAVYASPRVRILIVSQMWPGPDDPDLGIFVKDIATHLEALGHEVDHAAITHRGGGPAKHVRLARDAVRTARATRPDVVFAHFLFPAGAAALAAARAVGVPLVVMAHGQDVANLARRPIRIATAPVLRGAAAVIANSRWLADRIPGGADAIIDCGVDTELFAPRPRPPGAGPRFLCIGSLIERKNVVALADAFAELGEGELTFVGDGPLRGVLEGRPGVVLAGRVPHGEVPDWIARCDVLCQPSLTEAFGQAALEAMAMARSVVATTEGGPPEFVTPQVGVLVRPGDQAALVAALRSAAALGTPNPAARAAAQEHDLRRQVGRMADVLQAALG